MGTSETWSSSLDARSKPSPAILTSSLTTRPPSGSRWPSGSRPTGISSNRRPLVESRCSCEQHWSSSEAFRSESIPTRGRRPEVCPTSSGTPSPTRPWPSANSLWTTVIFDWRRGRSVRANWPIATTRVCGGSSCARPATTLPASRSGANFTPSSPSMVIPTRTSNPPLSTSTVRAAPRGGQLPRSSCCRGTTKLSFRPAKRCDAVGFHPDLYWLSWGPTRRREHRFRSSRPRSRPVRPATPVRSWRRVAIGPMAQVALRTHSRIHHWTMRLEPPQSASRASSEDALSDPATPALCHPARSQSTTTRFGGVQVRDPTPGVSSAATTLSRKRERSDLGFETMTVVPERPEDLPNFTDPPVDEVIIGLAFMSVGGNTSNHVAKYRDIVKDSYPGLQYQPRLPIQLERLADEGWSAQPPFGLAGAGMPLQMGQTGQRTWLVGSDDQRLTKIQDDGFLSNWRKRSEPYPRFEPLLREFWDRFSVFRSQLDNDAVIPLQLQQLEVSYINWVPVDDSPLVQWFLPANVAKLACDGSLILPEHHMWFASYLLT